MGFESKGGLTTAGETAVQRRAMVGWGGGEKWGAKRVSRETLRK